MDTNTNALRVIATVSTHLDYDIWVLAFGSLSLVSHGEKKIKKSARICDNANAYGDTIPRAQRNTTYLPGHV